MARSVTEFTDRSANTPAGTEFLHGHREGAGDTRSSKWTLNALKTWIIAGVGGGSFVTPPASSTSTGTAGSMAQDGDYFYVCVATNTWRRFPLSDW